MIILYVMNSVVPLTRNKDVTPTFGIIFTILIARVSNKLSSIVGTQMPIIVPA